jgi:hypothetical protein
MDKPWPADQSHCLRDEEWNLPTPMPEAEGHIDQNLAQRMNY